MGRKRLPAYSEILIEDIAAEGKSIARKDELVIFVRGAVPGDLVDLQVIRKRKSYQEAIVTKYIKFSELRQEPFCDHFGICGGCKWQNLPYAEQLKFKEKQVVDAMNRIAKLQIAQLDPIMGSTQTEFYRNKLEFTFSNHRWLTDNETAKGTPIENTDALGFHVPGRFDRIVDVEKCYLQGDPSNSIRNTVKEFSLSKKLSFYDHRKHEGLLRNLIVRTATTGELMVILSFQFDEPVIYELMDDLNNKVPGITSLMYVINQKKNETLYDQEIITYKGRDHIFEVLEDLKFKIGPKSFFQTNSLQALEMYRKIREFASLTGKEVVYDLYTGTGTIANFVAAGAKKVVGIESVPEAIEDAHTNSELNQITNTSFFAGDMKDLFSSEFIKKNGKPEVLITDPPRAGMHQNVVEQILAIAPKRIVYVSCNPATQARDVELLAEKYEVLRCQPVDMFPHTHHIENILLLELKI